MGWPNHMSAETKCFTEGMSFGGVRRCLVRPRTGGPTVWVTLVCSIDGRHATAIVTPRNARQTPSAACSGTANGWIPGKRPRTGYRLKCFPATGYGYEGNSYQLSHLRGIGKLRGHRSEGPRYATLGYSAARPGIRPHYYAPFVLSVV